MTIVKKALLRFETYPNLAAKVVGGKLIEKQEDHIIKKETVRPWSWAGRQGPRIARRTLLWGFSNRPQNMFPITSLKILK